METTTPSNQNVTPVAPTATETAPVAPAATGSVSANVSAEPKKNGKGLGVLAAVMACLAVAGVGFGVYGMVQASSKVTEVQDVQVQVKNDDGTTTTINKEAVATSKNANNKTVVTITEEAIVPVENTTDESGSAGGSSSIITPVNTEDYIYIGEWGIKIKAPEDFQSVGYRYNPKWDGTLCVTGVKGLGFQYFPDFADISGYPATVCVNRGTGEDYSEDGPWWTNPEQATFSIGNYYYWVLGPQAVVSIDEDEIQYEVEMINALKEALSNPENYSSI